MNRLKFPVGIPDFGTIRNEGYYYIDKTPHICRLIEQGRYFFLSRPRRFGKSLLLSTLKSLFEGNELLFEGLDIYDKWDWSVRHPVVRLSFDANFDESRNLDSDVLAQLEIVETVHGAEFATDSAAASGPARLRRLLQHLHAATGQQVVVLVDEYDKPIVDAIDQPEIARMNRNYLRGLYGVIKGCADCVRFVFVTGISMFSKVSLFSGLNNLNDISLDPRYATICGYTERDLDTVFAQELEGLDRDEIRKWYNGYNWRGEEKVYNPYDILLLFDTREFASHWFMTGMPTFLYRVMKEHQFSLLEIENLSVERGRLAKFDVGDIAPAALMFQTGYLTIAGEERIGSKTHFKLEYPNLEVREHLNLNFLEYVSEDSERVSPQAVELCDLLIANDFEGFADKLQVLLASIPYLWQKTADLARYEAWYASLLYACFQTRGYEVKAEESTGRGRSDIVVSHDDQVFVFELKVAEDEDRLDDMALVAIEQIREKGYAGKYRDRTKIIHLLGLAFCRETKDKLALKAERC